MDVSVYDDNGKLVEGIKGGDPFLLNPWASGAILVVKSITRHAFPGLRMSGVKVTMSNLPEEIRWYFTVAQMLCLTRAVFE